MAKDRFSNQKRSNYDKEFRYGYNEYSAKVKKNKVFTKEQKMLVDKLLKSFSISEWDKSFLLNLSNSNTYSEKQKLVLNKIYIKVNKLCGNTLAMKT